MPEPKFDPELFALEKNRKAQAFAQQHARGLLSPLLTCTLIAITVFLLAAWIDIPHGTQALALGSWRRVSNELKSIRTQLPLAQNFTTSQTALAAVPRPPPAPQRTQPFAVSLHSLWTNVATAVANSLRPLAGTISRKLHSPTNIHQSDTAIGSHSNIFTRRSHLHSRHR
jgi:hypothetical protein